MADDAQKDQLKRLKKLMHDKKNVGSNFDLKIGRNTETITVPDDYEEEVEEAPTPPKPFKFSELLQEATSDVAPWGFRQNPTLPPGPTQANVPRAELHGRPSKRLRPDATPHEILAESFREGRKKAEQDRLRAAQKACSFCVRRGHPCREHRGTQMEISSYKLCRHVDVRVFWDASDTRNEKNTWIFEVTKPLPYDEEAHASCQVKAARQCVTELAKEVARTMQSKRLGGTEKTCRNVILGLPAFLKYSKDELEREVKAEKEEKARELRAKLAAEEKARQEEVKAILASIEKAKKVEEMNARKKRKASAEEDDKEEVVQQPPLKKRKTPVEEGDGEVAQQLTPVTAPVTPDAAESSEHEESPSPSASEQASEESSEVEEVAETATQPSSAPSSAPSSPKKRKASEEVETVAAKKRKVSASLDAHSEPESPRGRSPSIRTSVQRSSRSPTNEPPSRRASVQNTESVGTVEQQPTPPASNPATPKSRSPSRTPSLSVDIAVNQRSQSTSSHRSSTSSKKTSRKSTKSVHFPKEVEEAEEKEHPRFVSPKLVAIPGEEFSSADEDADAKDSLFEDDEGESPIADEDANENDSLFGDGEEEAPTNGGEGELDYGSDEE